VLQGVEAEIGEPGRVRMAVDAEDAAMFPGFVVILLDDRFGRFRFSVFGFLHDPGSKLGKFISGVLRVT
jgi:hypothetical protein